jgi:hypothetical protein
MRSPEESTFILKSILNLTGIYLELRGSRSSLDLTGEFSKLEENATTEPVDLSESEKLFLYTRERTHCGSKKSLVSGSEKYQYNAL